MENVKPEVRAIPLAVAVIHSVTEKKKKKKNNFISLSPLRGKAKL